MYIKLIKNRKETPEHVKIVLNERLPAHLAAPLEVDCQYKLRPESDFFLLDLSIKALLRFECSRCGEAIEREFAHTSLLAVFSSETRAAELAQEYDAVVAEQGELDLTQVLLDELILYAPERHDNLADCHLV